jgi:predicted ATP-binding protein involved in virulence
MQDIFITSIKINKVRHLKELEIALSKDKKKHLILTGKNGSGKTSVLEAMAAIFENGSYDSDERSPLGIEFTSLKKWRNGLQKGKVVAAFYKTHNRALMITPEGPRKIDLHRQYAAIQSPASLFLQYLVNLQAEKAFIDDEGDTHTVEKIESWFTMFETTLQELFEDETLRLRFDRKNFNFSIMTKHREPFDFNTLSDGYATIINILGDLIMKMKDNPTNKYDMPGVVLIDDIETHLHAELQKKILPFLTNFFPKIQFIVSTHSPFVIDSLDNAVVYDLENEMPIKDLLAYSYDTIVEHYLDVGKYSEQIKRMLGEYETLLTKEMKTEEEEYRLMELRNYLTWIMHKFGPKRES